MKLIDLVNPVIISLSPTNLIRWLTFLLGSQCATVTVLLFSIHFFLLALVLVLQWLTRHWEILIMLLSQFPDFPPNWQRDAQFHCIAYDYSRAEWDSLRDPLRDVPWEDLFNLSASAAIVKFASGFRLEYDVYIPHHKYRVKPHSCPWFSAACAAAILHRNHFYCLYLQNKFLKSKVKFREASNRCKRVIEAATLVYANKTKRVHHFPETSHSELLANCK